MPTAVEQNVVYNFISDPSSFMAALDSIVKRLDNLEEGATLVVKGLQTLRKSSEQATKNINYLNEGMGLAVKWFQKLRKGGEQASDGFWYNLITNVGAFAEGMQRGIDKWRESRKETKKAAEETTKFGKSLSFVQQTLSTFIANVGVKLVGALTQVIGLIKNVSAQFVNFVKGATLQAARIEVQMRTLALTAGNAGERFEDVVGHLNSLRAAGIKTGEAIQILSQFLANEMPIKMVTELARRAQDMAVVIGKDSTEAFQRFNNFLQTGNSEWIRTMGIMKTGNQMLEEYARTQNKVVSAMTARERKEALIQGLMQETLRYEGAYEEAMKDPYKRWTSLPRLISNVTEVLGAVFVPMMGTVVDVASSALEKIERLFRVTKKEAKETGEVIGTWKEGFLRLRAVVTAFANWFMSIWNRITGGFNEASEGMMDRFVNAIVRGVRIAADALRRFARFVAGIFGGRAPAEVTPEAVAATKPTPKPAGEPRVAPPAGPPVETFVTPKKRRKLLEKPEAPFDPEEMAKYNKLMAKWRDLTEKLGRATEVAAKAGERLAKAQERLEKISEKVYDIRRKIQRLELDWAEIPERFIRGRRKQLQLELQAAQHEEHEAKKVVKAEKEKFRIAEKYRRELERGAEAAKRQADVILKALERQMEKYLEWRDALAEASQIQVSEPIQALVEEFESLDDLMAGYLEDIEGELMPAFADIEESVLSIASNFEKIWEFAKGLPEMAKGWLEKLREVRQWWDDLPEWVKNILKGVGIAVALSFLLAGGPGSLLTLLAKGLGMGATALGLSGGALVLAITALVTMVLVNKEELAKWFDPTQQVEESWAAQGLIVGLQKLFEWSPLNWITGGEWGDWTNENIVYPITERLLSAEDEIKEDAERGISEPLTSVMEQMVQNLVGESIIPDMVNSILDWMKRLADRLGVYLDQMAAKFRILEDSIKGLEPALADIRQFTSGGSIRVINISGPFNIGKGLTAMDVQRAIYDALFDMVRV